MRQYMEMESEHPDGMLLFRMGDFYEASRDDASVVSRVLGIALTARSKDSKTGEKIPLAGFPWHALDGYLTRLVRAGYRVAICEQVEDPSKAKGLVRREVVEVVTPGTLVSGAALDDRVTLLLCAAYTDGKRAGLALCDLSTGSIEATELDHSLLDSELARRSPRELLLREGETIFLPEGCSTTTLESWKFDFETAVETIRESLGVSTLEGLDLAGRKTAVPALGALLQYVSDTKGTTVTHLHFTGFYSREDFMVIDGSSARALGIVEALPGDESSVLAGATDETVTPPGSRKWRSWLLAPPLSSSGIRARHDAVEELSRNPDLLADIRRKLGNCDDLQRHSGKLGTLRAGPRDLLGISLTAALLPGIAADLSGFSSMMLAESAEMDLLEDVAEWIGETLSDEPPVRLGDRGVIRSGFSTELDNLRELLAGGKSWIESLVKRERESTGIPRLSVGFNRVFGYYIEVSKSFLEKVPDRYTRKQTLVGGERFITPELKEMESKILRAEEAMSALEQDIFEDLRSRVALEIERIRTAGEILATLDALSSLAHMVLDRGYVRPIVSAEPCLEIRAGRHPVLDRILPPGECVPNDINLCQARRIVLVTGPNMAGKSTYLREAALLTVMAQAGSFVPADHMLFSPVDRLFTRIGSSDHITRGQSTFLVEMSEVALLLNASSPRSLAILDEVGRGTSTFDGLSLAWAMVEYLHESPEHRPMVLFATHYHELTALVSRLPAAASVNILVRESGKKVIFLYRVEEGGSDRSYGIHVASMAGVPKEVLGRAKQVMHDLESGRHLMPGAGALDQLELPLSNPENPLLDEIRSLEPDSLTPRKALEILYELMEKLE